MKIFAIGDLHLSFGPGVEKPMDRFGEEWVNHAERLRANWMKEISPVDTVIICGDISWGLRLEEAAADFEWIRGLPEKNCYSKETMTCGGSLQENSTAFTEMKISFLYRIRPR